MEDRAMQTRKRNAIIFIAIVGGIIIGLAVAGSFNWTVDGLAKNDFGNPQYSTTEALPAVSADLEAVNKGFVAVAKRVIPTVVSITSEQNVTVEDPWSRFFHSDDFFKRFFQAPDGRQQEYKRRGLGSGVIVSTDGYILTNHHVVKDADQISVVIDKEEFEAEVVGKDPATDLAVVKIDKKDLPAIRLGDSDNLEVGEWVLAVGSPFSQLLAHTVTSGIISAKGRQLDNGLSRDLTYQDFIQTDAAINPGNSGGALVNIRGELIGINTAIYSEGGGNLGIGFAVPVNLAKSVMDDLISHGKVVRGYLGVMIGTPDAELSQALGLKSNKGAVINEVVDDSPAAKAGLQAGDVIVALEGKEIEDSQHLTNLVASYTPETRINLKVVREGKEIQKSVLLAERPDFSNAKDTPAGSKGSATGQLGFSVTELSSSAAEQLGYQGLQGVVVSSVSQGSVAFEKGLQRGDLITAVNRQEVASVQKFRQILDRVSAGDIVLFQVRRERTNLFLAMKMPEK
jgi:serine protease Do